MNSPLLKSGRLKFRLETNSAMMWLYAGGVSLILPDVRFGVVSQDWVTFYDFNQLQKYR